MQGWLAREFTAQSGALTAFLCRMRALGEDRAAFVAHLFTGLGPVITALGPLNVPVTQRLGAIQAYYSSDVAAMFTLGALRPHLMEDVTEVAASLSGTLPAYYAMCRQAARSRPGASALVMMEAAVAAPAPAAAVSEHRGGGRGGGFGGGQRQQADRRGPPMANPTTLTDHEWRWTLGALRREYQNRMVAPGTCFACDKLGVRQGAGPAHNMVTCVRVDEVYKAIVNPRGAPSAAGSMSAGGTVPPQ